MKYLFFLLITLCSCGTAKFIVTTKEPTGIHDNCVVSMKPITPKAEKLFKRVDGALVGCDQYEIGDTLIVNRKLFTGY